MAEKPEIETLSIWDCLLPSGSWNRANNRFAVIRKSTRQKNTYVPIEELNKAAGKPADAAKKPDGKVNDDKKDQKDETNKDKKAEGEPDAWTKQDDDKLWEMKTKEQKTWKEIAEAIGKSKFTCQKRFKELSDERGGRGNGAAGGEAKGGTEAAAKGGGDETGKEKKKQEISGLVVTDQLGGKKADNGKAQGFLELEPDDEFSLKTIISEEMHADRRDFWKRISARVFDKAGVVIHEDDLKKKLAGVET